MTWVRQRVFIAPFNRDWRKYAFAPHSQRARTYRISRLRVFWCRITGHRSMVWYNADGTEPDTHCENCFDDIG